MLINSYYNNRLIICIDLFLRQPAWGFFLFKPDKTGRPWNKTASCGFWCSKGLCTKFPYMVERLQFGLSEMIAANYPQLCHLQIRSLKHRWNNNLRVRRNFSSFFISASTKEHSVWGSLPWCLLTIPWVQCSVAIFINFSLGCKRSDLWGTRVWTVYGRTLLFSWKLILDIPGVELVYPDRVSVTTGSTAFEFPFSPTHCLVTIADWSEWK